MSDTERIVAVGLLSARDLERLGEGFHRVYPVNDADAFGDLLGALDRIEWPMRAEAMRKGSEQC